MLTEPTRRVIRTAGSCSGLMFCVLAGCATGRIGGGCCVPIDGLRLSTSVARTNRVAVLPAPYARETLIVSIDDCRAYESSDRGVHWRPAREDLSIPFGWYSYGTYPIDRQVQYRPNDVYHQGADTWTRLLERSNDGGVTWVPVKCLLMPGAQRLEPRELIYHPTDPNFVIALAKDSGIDQDREMGFYLSRDGGETFKRVLALAGTKFAVSQRNPDVFYAVSDDLTVYRSGDAGDRWVG